MDFWDLKYKPTLETFIFNDNKTKELFTNLTDLPNIFLSGPPGTGKTTLSKLLINKFIDPMDVLIINASDENGVDTIREKIKSFIRTGSFGKYKVVLLDECDYLSPEAQGILRALILDNIENARFILTCNYIHKVIPELISRCDLSFEFNTYDSYDVAEYIAKILIKEKVKFTIEDLDYFVNKYYPDIRRTIKQIQQNCKSGVLTKDSNTYSLINYIATGDWIGLRSMLASNPNINEYDFYTELFDNINKVDKFIDDTSHGDAILIIANWQNMKGPNKIINMVACALELISYGV